MIEKETRGEIDLQTFQTKKTEFTEKYGQPKHYKRLGLMICDRDHTEIDTRVRITNGKAEIMQKVRVEGHNDDISAKREISVPLESNADVILNAYQVLSNLFYNSNPQDMVRITAETENYTWIAEGCEIKLSNLKGKFDYYNFEVEAIDYGIDVKEIENKLGLIDMFGFSSEASKSRRRDLAINLDDISESDFKELIKKYL